MCTCPSDRLCDACLGARFAQLRGAAASRGETWADEVALKIDGERPWPAWSDALAEKAMKRVADLAPDPRLRAMLAAEANAYAKSRWGLVLLSRELDRGEGCE